MQSFNVGVGGVRSFVVGQTVSVPLCELTGVIVDVVLAEGLGSIAYVVVAFDTGPGEVTLFQPVPWDLLHGADVGYFVSAAAEDPDALPAALQALPVRYGGNWSRLATRFVPTPQSARVH